MVEDKLIKKRQGSKKTKKGWRKSDIQDVEEFLEDKRLEERLGAFDTREDHELFTIDTAPDQTILDKFENSLKDRRKKWLSETPHCFKVLESDSKVPIPVGKRNRTRTAEERKHPLLRKKEAEQREKGILKAKEIDRIRNRAIAVKRRQTKPVSGDFTKDIWDEDKALPPEISSEWVGVGARLHNVANSKLRNTVIRYKKRVMPSIVPAIEAPHPGMSYNPSFEEHKDLIDKIIVKETELHKKEAYLSRVTGDIFRKIPQGIAQAQWMKEMSEGVPVLDPEASKPDEEDPNENNEYQAVNPPVTRDKKKDKKTRRKAREELEKKLKLRRAKIEQKKLADLFRLKQIQKDLNDAKDKQEQRKKKREKMRALNADKPKRLGPLKFEEQDLEFNQASELKGSLRSMKPAGNLLADRFSSFQKRNIMHPTSKHIKHLSKKKKFSKASHKMDWEVDPFTRPAWHKKKRQANTVALGQ